MKIRTVQLYDREEWARLRNLLWPDKIENHLSDIDEFFRGANLHISEVFVIEESKNKLVGFLELNIRNYVEGSSAMYVPYIEGIYVDLDQRKKGLGRQLLQMAEQWALSNEFHELASDADLNDRLGIEVHKAFGFKETTRLVCLLKKLK